MSDETAPEPKSGDAYPPPSSGDPDPTPAPAPPPANAPYGASDPYGTGGQSANPYGTGNPGGNPYSSPGQPAQNPYGTPSSPPADPYGQAGQPYAAGSTAPGPQGNWPPPPVGVYNQVGQAYSPVNATMILILGILGVTLCGICAPIAWVMGNQALTTLNQYGDPLNQRGMVNGGRICGIIGTALIGLMVLIYVVMFTIGIVGGATHSTSF